MLHEDASVVFRSREHLAQFGGSLQHSESQKSTCGLQDAVLKARGHSFTFNLPIIFLYKAGWRRSWANRPWGRSHILQKHESEVEKGLVQGIHILKSTVRHQATDADALAATAVVGVVLLI